jgi:hypothetical protein
MKLPYLNDADIHFYIGKLKEENVALIEEYGLASFIEYFDREWMVPDSMPMWNLSTLNEDEQVTNNNVEGYNRKLNNILKCNGKYLPFWRL